MIQGWLKVDSIVRQVNSIRIEGVRGRERENKNSSSTIRSYSRYLNIANDITLHKVN